jgi:hypothetical protein
LGKETLGLFVSSHGVIDEEALTLQEICGCEEVTSRVKVFKGNFLKLFYPKACNDFANDFTVIY